MRDPQETTIESRRYRVVPLGAGRGLALGTMLVKALARGLEHVPTLESLVVNVPGGVIADIAAHLEEAQIERLNTTMADATQCELVPGDGGLVPLAKHFDRLYAANYEEWAAWMRFCIEVNYGFLGKLLAKVQVAGAAPPAASPAASG
jgi:hypothetical protein